jgi:hypothetical protein
MRFQHFTPWITDEDLGGIRVTPTISKNWNRVMNSGFSTEEGRRIEQVFEDVRLKEHGSSPSRRNCIYLFDLQLDPIKYAHSIWRELFTHLLPQMSLVEVETMTHGYSNIVRVDRSLVTYRFDSAGRLSADDQQLSDDARRYWAGTDRRDHETEVLFCGEFRYLRIITKAERPLVKAA